METQNNEMVQRSDDERAEHVRDGRRVVPPVDVFENNDEILLLVDVPGVDDSGLDIRLEGGQLEIEARQQPVVAEELGFEPLTFARSFTVPNAVDATKVAAELDKGVLKVHLPKSEAAKPRRIQVTVG